MTQRTVLASGLKAASLGVEDERATWQAAEASALQKGAEGGEPALHLLGMAILEEGGEGEAQMR